MKTLFQFLVQTALLLLVAAAHAETIRGTVVAVADGDTITVLLDQTEIKVRFHGIDCPESKQDFGTAARNYTADQCFQKTVTVVVTDTDRYGRKVGLVILKDGRVLNHELVTEGLAHWYTTYAPDDLVLRRLQGEAQAAKRGLWSRPDAVLPEEFRRGGGAARKAPYNPPSKTTRLDEGAVATPGELPATTDAMGMVYITETGTKYHKAGCRFLKDSRKALSAAQAQARYSPCGVCKP